MFPFTAKESLFLCSLVKGFLFLPEILLYFPLGIVILTFWWLEFYFPTTSKTISSLVLFHCNFVFVLQFGESHLMTQKLLRLKQKHK